VSAPPAPLFASSRRALLLACAAWGAAPALVGCGGGDGDGLATPPPSGTSATYALQAGRFASRDQADQLAASVRAQDGTSTVLLTVDERGAEWMVGAVGRYSSVDEAQSQRSYWADVLGLPPDGLAVIQLPALPAG